LIAAPMIVQPTSIMRVRAIIDPFGHHVRWLQDELTAHYWDCCNIRVDRFRIVRMLGCC
jgi:hypothetical protein